MGEVYDEHNRGSTQKVLVRYLKETESLQDLCVDGRTILNCILNK
jgi:hypothetical protein